MPEPPLDLLLQEAEELQCALRQAVELTHVSRRQREREIARVFALEQVVDRGPALLDLME